MQPTVQKILVVGGNGFVGSAVCRTALARGMQVVSVEWHKGSALDPETYAHLLPGATAVVHTIGTLFEKSGYKSAVRDGNVPRFVSSVAAGVAGSGAGANPLEREEKRREGSYEVVNRDTALRVCEAFVSSTPTVKTGLPRAFIYISAEDCTRPVVPAGYIRTKREAEVLIEKMILDHAGFRGVYIRPSLIYHPHFRPIVSPMAALLDLSATIHAKAPAGFPTPSGLLRALSSILARPAPSAEAEGGIQTEGSLVPGTPLDSMARALTIPPIHVDHVAEAICIAADNTRTDVRGPYGVREMRELIGWHQKGQQQARAHA